MPFVERVHRTLSTTVAPLTSWTSPGPATSENVNVPSTEPCGMPPFCVESAERANTA